MKKLTTEPIVELLFSGHRGALKIKPPSARGCHVNGCTGRGTNTIEVKVTVGLGAEAAVHLVPVHLCRRHFKKTGYAEQGPA